MNDVKVVHPIKNEPCPENFAIGKQFFYWLGYDLSALVQFLDFGFYGPISLFFGLFLLYGIIAIIFELFVTLHNGGV